jgi:hypothetical protein
VKETKRIHDAVELVLKSLYPHGDFDPVGDDTITRNVLMAFKDKLSGSMAIARSRRGGPRPNLQRWACAGVVAEAWEIIHGKAAPRSFRLYEACNEYWIACGGEDRGEDIENWRRDVERGVNVGLIKYVSNHATLEMARKMGLRA